MIRFLVDYRGVLTGEQFYRAGQEVKLPNEARLVAAGRAEYVEPDLEDLPTETLRDMAQEASLPGWHNMKRETLLERLQDV